MPKELHAKRSSIGLDIARKANYNSDGVQEVLTRGYLIMTEDPNNKAIQGKSQPGLELVFVKADLAQREKASRSPGEGILRVTSGGMK